MNQPPEKERLQATLGLFDNLLIAFGVVVSVGLIGEEFGLPHFGVAVAVGVTAEALLTFLHVRSSHRLDAMQELEIAAIRRDAAEANHLAEQDRLAKLESKLRTGLLLGSSRMPTVRT